MDKYLIGVLGGLIGSILTVVVSKILEIFQDRKKHDYKLQEHFFLKKLDAAEAVVTQCNLVSEALSQLIILYQTYKADESSISREINLSLWNQIELKIQSANNASLVLAGSISMYFDFDFHFDNDKIVTDFYDSLHSLAPYCDNIDIKFQEYSDASDKEKKQEAYENYLKAEDLLKEAMKKASESWNVFNVALTTIILQIREEMRKYDYKT